MRPPSPEKSSPSMKLMVPSGVKKRPRPLEIAAFALAINDDNPLYRDGRAVPPTYRWCRYSTQCAA